MKHITVNEPKDRGAYMAAAEAHGVVDAEEQAQLLHAYRMAEENSHCGFRSNNWYRGWRPKRGSRGDKSVEPDVITMDQPGPKGLHAAWHISM